jgi:hypothetical protein
MIKLNHCCGGNVGAFGKLIWIFGALRVDGRGPVGGINGPWVSGFIGGCVGMLPGLEIFVVFPVFC